MKKWFSIFVVLFVVILLTSCKQDESDDGYVKTDMRLGDLVVYEYTSDTNICLMWASKTLFETETYRYIYVNECPKSHWVLVDGDYVEILNYITEHDVTNDVIEQSGIGRKDMKD